MKCNQPMPLRLYTVNLEKELEYQRHLERIIHLKKDKKIKRYPTKREKKTVWVEHKLGMITLVSVNKGVNNE